MQKELKEYAEAFEMHLQAQTNELKAKHEVKATHYRLLLAKDALRAKERELLEDIELKTYEKTKN